ncbi:hypothetical protein SGH24_000961, partial [Escherichia coli]|nr:hypothetical protein [Escherichia coli]
GATWNIPDNATVQSVVDDLSHAGQIHFTSTRTGKFVPATLKVKNLNGQNGTISLRVRPDNRARYLNQELIVLVRCRKPVIFRVGICVGIR